MSPWDLREAAEVPGDVGPLVPQLPPTDLVNNHNIYTGRGKKNKPTDCARSKAQHELLLIVSLVNWINQSSLTFHKQISSEYDKCLHTSEAI